MSLVEVLKTTCDWYKKPENFRKFKLRLESLSNLCQHILILKTSQIFLYYFLCYYALNKILILLNLFVNYIKSLITSKTRINLLLKFFLNDNSSSYLCELGSEFGKSSNSIWFELNNNPILYGDKDFARNTVTTQTIKNNQEAKNQKHPCEKEELQKGKGSFRLSIFPEDFSSEFPLWHRFTNP